MRLLAFLDVACTDAGHGRPMRVSPRRRDCSDMITVRCRCCEVNCAQELNECCVGRPWLKANPNLQRQISNTFIHSLAYSKERSGADNFIMPVSSVGCFAPRPRFNGLRSFSIVRSRDVAERPGRRFHPGAGLWRSITVSRK